MATDSYNGMKVSVSPTSVLRENLNFTPSKETQSSFPADETIWHMFFFVVVQGNKDSEQVVAVCEVSALCELINDCKIFHNSRPINVFCVSLTSN